uniref:cGMP-dependent protein kinase n=1 Tax=Leptocylindrus danicus TaxID=163516 RepID=A0A7S2JSU2_9STRA|mmetsp:Transcript_10673/g.16018  ORF Transcript_10673/g.16018 Transcript_10673/m.16018 type:complete len:993 (+) Transcript_10673:279-3257(+)|eukprot:CAMPEP_0116011950 /NCGR_PEP_ID=MMETSP0321-20121206/4851_1 /TAXON_ID=163516 /ORGANISM="Leptocylindrus danicus var. danicus, Strain B650" /LENGTH=992 /DNA_ID=CAMNT_0003481237 /DNA_START=243 /DNA_END=3221 /DNA_ORIENTATION=+
MTGGDSVSVMHRRSEADVYKSDLGKSHRTSSGSTFYNMVTDGKNNGTRNKVKKGDKMMRRLSSSFTAGQGHNFRNNVFSARVDVDMKHFVLPKTQKCDETSEFISKVLGENFLFSSLSQSDIKMFIDAMAPMQAGQDDFIISQGDNGDYFYILEEGEVGFYINGKAVGAGGRGKSFGELALLHDCPRTASVKALTPCKLWKIEQTTFRFIMVHSTERSDKTVIEVLRKVPLFSNLDEGFFNKLANSMTCKTFTDGEIVIRKGDIGDTFYVVREGKVAVTEVGRRLSMRHVSVGSQVVLGVGQSFGERALLTGEVRSATIIAAGNCDLLCLDRKDFEEILGNLKDLLELARWRHILTRVPLFSNALIDSAEKDAIESLNSEILGKLTIAMTKEEVSAGEVIMKKGDVGDKFYIIRDGHVELSCGGENSGPQELDLELGAGDFFGEHSLFTGEPRHFTVVSRTDCVLSCLTRDSCEKLLAPLQKVLERARWRRVLLGIPQVAEKKLEQREMDLLVLQVTTQGFRRGETLSEQDEDISKRSVYILNHGKVSIKRDGAAYTFSPGAYFGDSALAEDKSVMCNGEVITFLQDSVCGVLSAVELQAVLSKFTIVGSTALRKASIKKYTDIKIADFQRHQLLGRGSFGKVWLVSREGDNELCALKVMIKSRIYRKRQSHFVINERKVMAALEHPFIIKLVSAFQDDFSLYMLLSLVEGGEMYELMKRQESRRLGNDAVCFYSACMIDALGYIHSHNICHRDIKAENIMLDRDGYSLIIDFGFAKVVENKTFTLCGTPYYLAPEMLLSKGYNKGADYWAFAVLMYEMLVGNVPFSAGDEMSVYRLICSLRYTIPEDIVKPEAADLLEKIFVKPKKRLGCLVGGVKDITEHPFFDSINWDDLLARKAKPPFEGEAIVANEQPDSIKHIMYQPEDANKLALEPEVNALFSEFGPQVKAVIAKPKPPPQSKLSFRKEIANGAQKNGYVPAKQADGCGCACVIS